MRCFQLWNFVCLSVCLLMLAPHVSIAAEPATERQTNTNTDKLTKTLTKLQQGEATRIVCLGDSVTGLYYHTGGIRAYTDMLGLALQQTFPNAKLTMINAGISGHTTQNGLDRLQNDVLKHQPDLVTVTFGLNDMTRVPPEQYRANLITTVARCREIGAEVMLCTPNDVIDTPSRPIKTLEKYCDIVREVGKTLQVPVADCYAGMEALRVKDELAWRLLLSDEIHPNLEGHKRMAEIIATAVTGKAATLEAVATPPLSLARVAEGVKAGRPIRVLAMSPFDAEIKPVLEKRFPGGKWEITTWSVADRTLPDLELEAQKTVRAFNPDLVIIAVPRSAKAANQEGFIKSYAWIMNWSLNFGHRDWECVVVHPSVADPGHAEPEFDDLVRKLVHAQDLQLIDRPISDQRPAAEIFGAAFKE